MSVITTKKRDVAWNYVGTIISMGSGFLLLPLLLGFLTSEELGLWYVYMAISNLTQLFEFGFSPTFARNIIYCLSGARTLSDEGVVASDDGRVDWKLFFSLLKASKLVYAAIAILSLILTATIGTFYISQITREMDGLVHWVSWGIFCFAMFLNLYFLYWITYLRGMGDVAGENKAKTVSKLIQLIVTAFLLFGGMRLIGASIGFLVNGIVLRVYASYLYRKDCQSILPKRCGGRFDITGGELRIVFREIRTIAWKDGVVQISLYASTQATSLMSSALLGLSETGMYSVLLQLSTAVYNFAGAFVRSYYPMFQSAFASSEKGTMQSVAEKGTSAYWILFCIGTLGIILVVFPLLPYFKPGIEINIPFYLFLSIYLALLNHHSIFCNFIISMNEIPYMVPYLVTSLSGLLLSWFFIAVGGLGAWGLVAGQFVSQLCYNNWKWPLYVVSYLGISYKSLLSAGVSYWLRKLKRALRDS